MGFLSLFVPKKSEVLPVMHLDNRRCDRCIYFRPSSTRVEYCERFAIFFPDDADKRKHWCASFRVPARGSNVR